MPTTLTPKTLIPISVVGFIGAASFWLSESNAKIEEVYKRSSKNELAIESQKDENNRHYITIIERLTRIEEAIKK